MLKSKLSLLLNPHGRCWDCARLEENLREYVGGQFQLLQRKADDSRHLRGEIQTIEVKSGIKTVKITFNWLLVERLVHNSKLEASLKWFSLERPDIDEFGYIYLNVPFDSFRSHPDEERVKMWGGGWGEVSRFFKPNDHTNLVKVGDDEWIPFWKKHELAFKLITSALLSQK